MIFFLTESLYVSDFKDFAQVYTRLSELGQQNDNYWLFIYIQIFIYLLISNLCDWLNNHNSRHNIKKYVSNFL